MFCGNCGKPLNEGALFCPECGTPVKKIETENVNGGNDSITVAAK